MTRRTLAIATAMVLLAGTAHGGRQKPSPAPSGKATSGQAVRCGPAGVEATVSLEYDEDSIGKVKGTAMLVGFRAPVSFPSTANGTPGRLTKTSREAFDVDPPIVQDPGTVRTAVLTLEPGIPAGDVFTVRFDCAAGTPVRAQDFTCRTDEVVEGTGSMLDPSLARRVGCRIRDLRPAR